MIDPNLLDLMPDEIVVESWLSADSYGTPTYGPTVTYQCRVEGEDRLIRDREGRELVANNVIYIGSVAPIGLKDRITLTTGEQPVILAVKPIHDESGSYYTELYVGDAHLAKRAGGLR